ncbi:hypothetical protein [endosymbiont GvMRE of Glomus versiforme]|uniref:hypothetical protein n=1 Tax=endosymbiont GvMRE of Glomus versiforme TaxID=2039283 RepID=UPI000ED0FE97|nr:hypothetical protein [endosymbiont GvMRE of Glomus versiforme]RHZ37145.1 hypothetical protein GvMRE_I1g496 [endosymbiont GvMRE of Glomus versiforme]
MNNSLCALGRKSHSWKTLSWNNSSNTLNYYGVTQCQFCFLEKNEPVKYQVKEAIFIQGHTCQLCNKTTPQSTWFYSLVEQNSQEKWIICEVCSRKY